MTIEDIHHNLCDNKILTNSVDSYRYLGKLYIKKGMFKTFVIDYSSFTGKLYIYELSDENLEEIKDHLSLSFNETINNLIATFIDCLDIKEVLENHQTELKRKIIEYLK